MRYKRQKPNRKHWQQRRTTHDATNGTADKLKEIGERVTAAIRDSFIARGGEKFLINAQEMLDLHCATDGHRFDPSFDNCDTCLTCGRSQSEIKGALADVSKDVTLHRMPNIDGTFTHIYKFADPV